MKKLLYTTYSEPAFSIGLLLLRVACSVMMIAHGYDKVKNFAKYSAGFADPFNVGPTVSLSFDIFAEFVCAILILLGLCTRFAVIPLIIAMGAALFTAHNGDIFGAGEKAALYLVAYTAILFTGPGRFSIDRMIVK
jgi:putative oxidoreductase